MFAPKFDPLESAAGEIPRPVAPLTLAERIAALRNHPKISAGAIVIAATMLGLVWHQSSANTRVGTSTSVNTPGSDSSSNKSGGNEAAALAAAAEVTKSGAAEDEKQKDGAPEVAVVHVAGAVMNPGLQSLDGTARLGDAIAAAGGALTEADLDRVNLAAPVVDGSRVYVPFRGLPSPPVEAGSGGGSGSGAATGANEDGAAATVNLNSATQAELETLPGVGPSLAQAILNQRQAQGGFRSVDELRSVRGIGDKRFADLKDLVSV